MINIIEDIIEKYKIEKKDADWLKMIIKETYELNEENEKLEKNNQELRHALAQTIDTINNYTKGYFYERRTKK